MSSSIKRERLPDLTLIERAAKKLSAPTATGCVEWLGATKKGYGTFWDGQRTGPAHRILFEATHGVRLTREQIVCHSCDNPKCCNVLGHLWLGTAKDNTQDMIAKGRRGALPDWHMANLRSRDYKGSKNNGAKLTDEQVDAIRASRDTAKTLAVVYGVRDTTIYRIRSGARWPHKAVA